jgi:hypothetical protein
MFIRWNSTHAMIERFIYLRPAFERLFPLASRTRSRNLYWTTSSGNFLSGYAKKRRSDSHASGPPATRTARPAVCSEPLALPGLPRSSFPISCEPIDGVGRVIVPPKQTSSLRLRKMLEPPSARWPYGSSFGRATDTPKGSPTTSSQLAASHSNLGIG